MFTLGGVLAGGLLSWIGTAYLNRRAERQKLRDDKSARLRAAFAPILRYAATLPIVVARQKYLVEDETEEARDDGLSELLTAAQAGTANAEVALMLEPGLEITDIGEKIRSLSEAFTRYRDARGAGTEGIGRPGELVDTARAVHDAVESLAESMAAVLASIEQPLPFFHRPGWCTKRQPDRDDAGPPRGARGT